MSEATEMKPEMPAHGSICWSELATRDLTAAREFYGPLLGWEMQQSKAVGNDMQYIEFHAGGRPCGGLFQMGAEFGAAPSHWMTYMAVDDVDAAAAKVPELGGQICVPPTDIPNVGRFAVVNDPTGATFSLITLAAPSGQ